MMRKSTIFISAVLTTFALVMLYGVVSAYQNLSNIPEITPVPTDTATPEPTLEPTPTQSFLTPEQAAQLAAQVVGNTNLLSAESSSINGTDAYKITFTNNDLVYVGLDGQILGLQIAPVVVNVVAAAPAPAIHKNKNKDNNTNTVNQSNDDSHEEHEEHEEHDD